MLSVECSNCRRVVAGNVAHPQSGGTWMCTTCCDTVGVCYEASQPRRVERPLLTGNPMIMRDLTEDQRRRIDSLLGIITEDTNFDPRLAYFDDSVEDLPTE